MAAGISSLVAHRRAQAARYLVIAPAVLLGLATVTNARQQLDVISVRESAGGLPRFVFQPGRVEIAEWELRGLVAFAFAIPAPAIDKQIEGWPDRRLPGRRFSVTATYSGANTPALGVQRRLIQEILEDRFRMRTHVVQREQAVYALRLIKPGVLGRGIVKVDYDCTDPATRARRDGVDCRAGDRTEDRGDISRDSGPIGVLVARLQLELRDRLIVDQTGLDGFYRWELLRWERRNDGGPVSRPPSLRDLLPVQLGMILQDTRARADTVVIDAISMPTPN